MIVEAPDDLGDRKAIHALFIPILEEYARRTLQVDVTQIVEEAIDSIVLDSIHEMIPIL